MRIMIAPIAVLGAILALTGCNQQQDPKTIAQQYWQALANKDLETARSLVSNTSKAGFDEHVRLANTPADIDQVALDDQRTVVVTTINPDQVKPYRDRPFNTVMVLEDGVWKIDLDQTRLPAAPSDFERKLEDMTNDLNGSVEQNLGTMHEMLDEGMKLFDESLDQGSKDMADSFGQAMHKMQESMRKAIDKLKQHREQPQPAPAPQGDTDTGEGAI